MLYDFIFFSYCLNQEQNERGVLFCLFIIHLPLFPPLDAFMKWFYLFNEIYKDRFCNMVWSGFFFLTLPCGFNDRQLSVACLLVSALLTERKRSIGSNRWWCTEKFSFYLDSLFVFLSNIPAPAEKLWFLCHAINVIMHFVRTCRINISKNRKILFKLTFNSIARKIKTVYLIKHQYTWKGKGLNDWMVIKCKMS